MIESTAFFHRLDILGFEDWLDAVNVHSIRNSNQFQIVRRKDFPFRVVYLHSNEFSGAFV